MYRYEVVVNFNYETCGFGDENKDRLSSVQDKYHALCLGNEKKGTSTLLFSNPQKISKEDLSKELGGLEIVMFSETKDLSKNSKD